MHVTPTLALPFATLVLLVPLPAQQPNPESLDALRKAAWASVDVHGKELENLSNRIWRFAETSLKENRSSAALASYLEQQGFKVERGVADIPTAFVARHGSGKPGRWQASRRSAEVSRVLRAAESDVARARDHNPAVNAESYFETSARTSSSTRRS